jgi:hypothetical protein
MSLHLHTALAAVIAHAASGAPAADRRETVASGASIEFSVPTRDGKAALAGQLDFPVRPACAGRGSPLVLMVPGSGIFDRDVLFGHSGGERDLIFKDLAGDFLEAGLAVLRYDYRGVSCNMRTMPPCPSCETWEETVAHFASHCIDARIRQEVTPENIRTDIAQLFALAAQQVRVDRSRIVVFGHSEGSLHTAHLVHERAIDPVGLLFMGMLAESPQDIVRWQIVERYLRILSWDADGDRVITTAEVAHGYERDPTFRRMGIPLAHLEPPAGFWTEASLTSARQAAYSAAREAALATPDHMPFPPPDPATPGLVQASFRWWKMFFTDDRRPADLLLAYPGRMVAHNGSIDSQTPADRQFAILKDLTGLFRFPPTLVFHENRGHSLSESPIYGPIDEEAKRQLVAGALELACGTASP